MHYEKTYQGKSGEAEALQDALDWLSPKQLQAAKQVVMLPDTTLDLFRLAMSFVGIKGYPVKVLYEHLRKELDV